MVPAVGHRKARPRPDLAGSRFKPWTVEGFRIFDDRDFEEKLVDVVGLDLDPTERAVGVQL
jgi:hypothetical protein